MARRRSNKKFYATAFSLFSFYLLLAAVLAVQTIDFARMMGAKTTYGSYLIGALRFFDPRVLINSL